ncbi:hypothetical protein F4703DRAFT_1979451 [Phycomyces blakesleeanus]
MKAWEFLSSGWTNFTLPTNIQKRLYKFLLRKAIGQFLANELDLENFDIALVNGSVELRDLDLNLQTLNDCLTDTPFVLESGRVSSISASLPWANFWSGDIALRIQGLHLALRPVNNKPKKYPSKENIKEEDTIMSSSLHFADDFLRTEIEPDQNQALHESIQHSLCDLNAEGDDIADAGLQGLQVLTRVIDKMLAKVKIEIVDSLVRIIHTSAVPLACDRDKTKREYFMDLEIKNISYFDETPAFSTGQPSEPPVNRNLAESSILLPPVADETIKIITFSSPTLHIRSNATPPPVPSQSETTITSQDDDLSETEFYEADEGDSLLFQTSIHSYMSGSITPRGYPRSGSTMSSKPYEALLFSTMDKDNWISVKLRPSYPFNKTSDSPIDAPAIKQLDIFVTHIRAVVTPQQTAFILDLFQSIGSDTFQSSSESHNNNDSDNSDNDNFTDNNKTDILADLGEISSSPSKPRSAPRQNNIPQLKIKLQIGQFEFFALYRQPISWQSSEANSLKDVGHLRLSINQIIARIQQFPQQNPSISRLNQHSSDRARYPLNSATQRPSSVLSSTIDLQITQLALEEWIEKPPGSSRSSQTSSRSMGVRYECYNDILTFDPTMPLDYENQPEFPSVNHRISRTSTSKTEVIRLRIEKRQSYQVNRFINDTQVDLQAFRLAVDPRIADRLENYVYALASLTKNQEKKPARDTGISNNSFGQQVYDDLDQTLNLCQERKKARIKCAFIRLVLYVPDMSQSSTRDEFNDHMHADLLSVDVQKVVASWQSDDGPDESQIPGREDHTIPSAYTPHQTPIDRNLETPKPTKVSVDVNAIYVFVTLAKDQLAHCFFTAMTTLPLSGMRSDRAFAAQSPTFEITSRSPGLYSPMSSARPGYFGAGSDIPSNLFEHLSRNETFNGEQKLHVPMEDQSESAMMFKQRTVETALIVLNCHFPVTRMNLTKPVWDTVQVLQNDLLLWQPKFISTLSTDPETGHQMSMSGSLHDAMGMSDYHQADGRYSLLESSVLSQSHERLGFGSTVPASSLFAIVAVISEAAWDLHYTPENGIPGDYQARFTEFRYFAVMKHLNTNENITTLDIDELALDDMSDPLNIVPVLYKTIPKSLNMVYIDPPAQYIKIYAHVLDTSIDYKPINTPSRGVAVIDDLQVITEIIAGQPLMDIKTYIQSIDVFLSDDASELDEKRAETLLGQVENKTTDPRRYWMTIGLSPVLSIRNLETTVKIKMDPLIPAPATDIAIHNNLLTIEGSSDSFQSLVNFATYIANQGDTVFNKTHTPKKSNKGKSRRRSHVSLSTTKKDMLSSLDEDAFRQNAGTIPERPSGQDSDTLSGLSYVEGYYSGKPSVQPDSSASMFSTSSFIKHGPQKPRRRQAQKPKAEDVIRVLLDNVNELDMVEDYYGVDKKAETKKSLLNLADAILSVRIEDFDVLWKLYDGYDWIYMRDPLRSSPRRPSTAYSSSPASVDSRSRMSREIATENSPSENSHFLSHSPPYSVSEYSVSQGPASEAGFLDESTFSPSLQHDSSREETSLPDSRHRSSKIRSQTNRLKRRSRTAKIEIHLEGISVALDLMPDTSQTGIHLKFSIRDVEMIDNIKTSSWKKFLGYMRPDSSATPRERGSSMVDIELSGIRPVAQDPTQEFRLKVNLLPIRLYVDQDALDFLVNYFTFDKLKLRSTPFTNATIPKPAPEDEDDEDEANPVFFQYVEIFPIVLKVDYKPKYINYGNIKEGQFAELINLFHLDGAEMSLNHVKLTGIAGIERVFEKLGQEWLPHIKNTQVPNMVSGVAPIRSIVNLSSGVADLVLLPLQQYRKDGIQKGTHSFARATAIEAINLSARFASGTQVILEHADGFFATPTHVSPNYGGGMDNALSGADALIYATIDHPIDNIQDNESDEDIDGSHSAVSKFADQPSDLSQGFQYAYHSLSKNIGSAAQTIFTIPVEFKDRGSDNQATSAKAVIKAVPVAVLKPMIGLTGAFQSILVGLRNTIDPTRRLQNEDVSL